MDRNLVRWLEMMLTQMVLMVLQILLSI